MNFIFIHCANKILIFFLYKFKNVSTYALIFRGLETIFFIINSGKFKQM